MALDVAVGENRYQMAALPSELPIVPATMPVKM